MLINITVMKGEVPRLKPHLLPNDVAVIARDCEFENGIITPLNTSILSEELSRPGVQTLFRYLDTSWLTWTDKVSVINSPIAQDEWQRVYWTGQGAPKVSSQDIIGGSHSPAAWYDLGVPAPTSAPVVANVDNSTGSEPAEGELAVYDDEDRIYIQTFLTRFSEEGSNSPPSMLVTILKPGATVTISLAPVSVQNTHNVTKTRLYRSVTSNGEGAYMLVAELPIAQSTYVDSAAEINNAVLETTEFTVPDENMQGLTNMANGICAGFAGNEVMFSEAYLPYAWPEQYRATTEHEIVNIAAIETDLVVVTKGYPYLFSGITPSMVNGTSLKVEQACVSADSLVVLNGLAVYASPDGLIAVSRNGVQQLTKPLITRKQWQSYKPNTIKAWVVEGVYIAQTDTGAFIFDPVSLSFTHLSNSWSCAFNDLITDQLYFVSDSNLMAWKAGDTCQGFTWRSKNFLIPFGQMFSCCKIKSDAPELLAMTFYIDDVAVHSLAVGEITDQAFRLPALRGKKCAIEMTGTAEVEQIMIADSMMELS